METLLGYVGEYELQPGVMLVVTMEGGRLRIQPTGQEKLAMYAESVDHFFLRGVNAQFTFQRDAAGAVTGVVLRQNGGEQPARKVK